MLRSRYFPGRSLSRCENVKAKTCFFTTFLPIFIWRGAGAGAGERKKKYLEPEPVKSVPAPQHWPCLKKCRFFNFLEKIRRIHRHRVKSQLPVPQPPHRIRNLFYRIRIFCLFGRIFVRLRSRPRWAEPECSVPDEWDSTRKWCSDPIQLKTKFREDFRIGIHLYGDRTLQLGPTKPAPEPDRSPLGGVSDPARGADPAK